MADRPFTDEPEPTEEEIEQGHPFWPTHVLDQVVILYVLGGLIITLAILLPFHLLAPADPLHTPEGIKPEWYFLPTYQMVKYVPRAVGMLLFAVAAVLLVFWPLIDQRLDRRFGLHAYRKVGWAVVGLIVLFAAIGWVSERNVTVAGSHYHIDLLGIPHRVDAPAPSGGGGVE